MMVTGARDKGSIFLIDVQKVESELKTPGDRRRPGMGGPSRAPKFKPSFDRPASGLVSF